MSGKTCEQVALFTSRGSLYTNIKELTFHGMEWKDIQPRLLERFSEYGSSSKAQHKLGTLKQENLPMHELISKFTILAEYAYNINPHENLTRTLTPTSVEAIHNSYIRSKLRDRTANNLKEMFQFALEEDNRQNSEP